MASFIGRSGYHILFAGDEDDRAVIVDSRVSVVLASGALGDLGKTRTWGPGEFSAYDEQAAETALESLNRPAPESTGRLYTIPRGVKLTAERALKDVEKSGRGDSSVARHVAALLASGGQIDFNGLVNVSQYFERHADDDRRPKADGSLATEDILWRLRGGDAGQKWASAIVAREPVLADAYEESPADLNDLLTQNGEVGPEFIVKISLIDGQIVRLYRVDIDGRTYVWNEGAWDDMGHVDWDIWNYDQALDIDPSSPDEDEATHLIIDPESALQIAGLMQDGPGAIYVEDLNPDEAQMAKDASPMLDWELLDSTVTAAGGTPGDGIYTPDERSQNAEKQLRDAKGMFATVGNRVMVGGNPTATGKITQVNPANGTVEVSLESGGSTIVPAKSVEGVSQYTATIPGQPVEVPRVDLSGILAEPRTPINRTQGQIPGTLPQMTSADLHELINNFPAWVKAQREAFQPVGSPGAVQVQNKNSLDTGAEGRKLQAETGKTITTDAYANPLLNQWLNKHNSAGYTPNKLWYDPIIAAASAPVTGEVTPDNSDVAPIYLAVVSPDDPRAVFALISIVPAGPDSNAPMCYKRQDGAWVRDEQDMFDLKSATPPPVVPLDPSTLQDVVTQVDQHQSKEAPNTDNGLGDDGQPLPGQVAPDPTDPTTAPTPASTAPASPSTVAPAPTAPSSQSMGMAASAADFELMVLWGPRKDIMASALIAAGGADQDRGGAEKLRRYWTKGPGAAKIGWNTPGDWTRCVRNLGKYLGPRAKGYCALRHKEMTHMWPGDKKNRQTFSVNSGGKVFSTSMVSSTEKVMEASYLRAHAAAARERFEGLTADASDVSQVGGAFFIPIAIPEGTESGDGRTVDLNALSIRNLPISLLWQIKTADGHDGSVVVGMIEKLGRVPGGIGAGYGHFDTGAYGREAERMVRAGMLRYVSGDMDNFEAVKEEDAAAADPSVIKAEPKTITQARVMAVTIVAKPAYQEATIQIVPDMPLPEEDMIPEGIYMDEPDPLEAAALIAAGYVASVIPITPPAEWFLNPNLTGPTPLTVTDDGRVFGHIAAWDQPHMSPHLSNVRPPRSKSGYGYFHTGVVRTEQGSDIPVGQLTLAGGHADITASAAAAVKHYDDTASAVADVHAGEDQYGIWVAGSLRTTATPEQIRALRASAPSGDWRPIKNSLELVAVCQVNVPGFPIARAMVASGGHITALVAAGAATLARMKSDPVQDLDARLKMVEQFSNKELSIQASAAKERFDTLYAPRAAELSTQREAVLNRMESFGFVSQKARAEAADKGQALPDGSYPIRNHADLKNAIQACGRAKDEDKPKVRRHIMKRARALGAPHLIPENWKSAASEGITASVTDMRQEIERRQSLLASAPVTTKEKQDVAEVLKAKADQQDEAPGQTSAPKV